MTRHRVALLAALLVTAAIVGCTPHFRLQAQRDARAALDATRREPPPLPGYLPLAGVIHVHTELSHDSRGTMDEITAAAKANGLGYVVLTDHHQPKVYQRGFDGWRDGVLFVRGSEVIKGCAGRNAAKCNSLLVIGLPEYFKPKDMTMQQVVDHTQAGGGLAFVAHVGGFADWSVDGFDAIELYDILDAAMEQRWKAPKLLFDVWYSFRRYPEELYLPFVRAPTAFLERWDALTARRPVVAVAGNDAHQNVRVLGRQLDPYALSFKVVRTHLLVREHSRAGVLEALRSGHAYVGFDLIVDARGVQVWAGADDRVEAIMGDRLPFRPELKLSVRAPIVGELRLIRDGALVTTAIAKEHAFTLDRPGVYRVEIWAPLAGRYRPWVYANPIYVTPPS